MKRVLFLAYYFPPIAASGSLRPAGFSAHLHEYGYEALIVSTDTKVVHPPVRIDPSLFNLVEAGVRVERLEYTNWLKVLLDMRGRIRGNNNISSTDKVEPSLISPQSLNVDPGMFSRTKTAILNRLFLYPDHQKPWISAVRRFAKTLEAEMRPDVIVASGNPWSALIAGNIVAKELGVPFVADFRDPWTGNPKAALSEALHRSALKDERIVLEGATRVIANTEALQDWFETTYPDLKGRFVSITNGYHETFRKEIEQLEAEIKRLANIELCHLGSIYELRKPTALLKALAELVENKQIFPGDILLRFTGTWLVEDVECNKLADQLEQKGFLMREEAVSHSEYLLKLKESQHLLILQQSFPLQIPGKIYEYIASGRPLVVIGDEGATESLVSRYELGTSCLNDIDSLKGMLQKLVSDELQVPKVSESDIERFGYRQLTGQLAIVLDEAIEAFEQRKK